ncbi:MAG: DUF3299 domain-containing protein [Alphaproteobacteria bacterium]|nr:DUF3299 domain-containing protein [Alphaproteobacteria bacterium]
MGGFRKGAGRGTRDTGRPRGGGQRGEGSLTEKGAHPLLFALAVALIAGAAAMHDGKAKKSAMSNYTIVTETVTGHIDSKPMILDAPTRTIADFVKDYVNVPEGGTDWRVFAKTKEIEVSKKMPGGYDYVYYKPGFAPAVEKLDGKEVTVKGFMFPLGAAEKQKIFLFGPFPVSCPFHYHVSPALVVEVHADKAPVAFSYDAITLRGKLRLVKSDPENSTFYRLLDARQVKTKK